MNSVREKRLRSDHEKLAQLARTSGGSLVISSVKGNPPEEYRLTFSCPGIERVVNGRPVLRQTHGLLIQLPPTYPSPAGRPYVRFETPIWHPHVFVNNSVCLGQWQINEHLDQLALRLGALIQYDPAYFDFRSPANQEASLWAQRNLKSFPVGTVSFRQTRPSEPSVSWTNLK